MRWNVFLGLAVLAGRLAVAADAQPPPLAEADGWWQRRAEGAEGTRAASANVERAIELYAQAIVAAPDDLTTPWHLLRALYFKGEFVAQGRDAKLAIYTQGRSVAEAALGRLARRVGEKSLDGRKPSELGRLLADQPDAAALYFWSAVMWGLWGENTGKLAAARQGVGDQVRDDAATVNALDESLEAAGGHRMLGRLHAEAPRVPFFTGWVDRKVAISELERAYTLAPEHPLNALYLAEALLDHGPASAAQRARELLEHVVSTPPRPDFVIEDAVAQEQARARLARLGH